MFMRLCSDYSDVIRALRDRTDELQLSRGAIDSIAGLSDGYSAKLLSEHPSKVMGPASMGPTLQTLGLRLMLVEDTAATERTIGRRTPVVASHRRLGNQSNPKKIKSTKPAALIPAEGEEINTTVNQPAHPAPQRTNPLPESRSHLRIVQMKNGRKYG